MPMDPNFNRGTGRLTTDRFDFEKHTNGTNARHDGYAIDMVPPMIILGNPYSDVRSAIEALNAIIAPVSVQDATGTIKGILKLTQDLGGTAALPTVTGLQTKPVSTLAPTSGQVLTWNGSAWEPQDSSNAFTPSLDLSGNSVSQTVVGIQGRSVFSGAPGSGAVLEWITANNRWEPSNSVTSLTITAATNTITDTSIASGDILLSNGTKFVRKAKGANGTFLGVSGGVVDYYTPSSVGVLGTGFVTATANVFDANATANIRYTGGKFQTDVAIQYKNGAFTGDLTWVPSTSRTLSLPDATDTVVAKNTVDIFTNKTFDVAGTGNFLTATSQAAGDLLKNDGTQFSRFARGTANQILAVNSGGTDLTWTDTLTGKTMNVTNNTITATSQATGDLLKNNGTQFLRFAKGTALQVLRVNSGATDLEWASLSAGINTQVQTSDGSGGFIAGTLYLTVATPNASFFSVGSIGHNNDLSTPTQTIFIPNSTNAPGSGGSATNPTGGGLLYASGGNLFWKTSGGTITQLN